MGTVSRIDQLVWHEGSAERRSGKVSWDGWWTNLQFLPEAFRLHSTGLRIQGKVMSRRGTESTLRLRPFQLTGGTLNGLGE